MADVHSEIFDTPRCPSPFNFMQFLEKIGKIIFSRPPGELASPPRRNSGSATATHECLNPTFMRGDLFAFKTKSARKVHHFGFKHSGVAPVKPL